MPSGSPAAWLLLLVPALVFVAEPFFVAHDSVGRGNSFRDAPFALIVGLAGLWMAVTVGRHVLSAALAGIGGVGLVFDAILAPHEYFGVTVTEAVCGVFAVVVAAIAAAQSTS
ncbi:hypothetical protein ASG90_16190 [Nocardioides sp. Soil797]|nr:hypothetical protein ASG90_16190 [Nocardioides sp. Soil797]